MLLVMMKYLPQRMKRRNEIAMRYNEALSDLVLCPQFKENNVHALYTYAIQADNRDKLMMHLNENEIETKIYHDPLVSDAPVFEKYRGKDTPNARRILSRFLSIPAHEKLSNDQVDFVIEEIKRFYS